MQPPLSSLERIALGAVEVTISPLNPSVYRSPQSIAISETKSHWADGDPVFPASILNGARPQRMLMTDRW